MKSTNAEIIKSVVSRIWLLVQGMLFGGALFACLAILSTVIDNGLTQRAELCRLQTFQLNLYAPSESCVPGWIFSLLGAFFTGPGFVLWFFTWPLPLLYIQIASGIILSGLAGLLFSVAGRKWGIAIFLLLYLVMIVLLTLIYLVMALTG